MHSSSLNLSSLPDEVLLLIGDTLDKDNLVPLSLASKQFNHVFSFLRTKKNLQANYSIVNVVKTLGHLYFLDSDGHVWFCWQENRGGISEKVERIAINMSLARNAVYGLPIKCKLPSIKQIIGDYFHIFLLGKNGQVWAAGLNDNGQLGTEPTFNLNLIPSLLNIVQIEANKKRSFFLDKNGDVWACGNNKFGSLGIDPSLNNQDHQINTPTKIPGLPKIKTMFADEECLLLLDIDGKVWITGLDDGLELSPNPVHNNVRQIANISNIESIFGFSGCYYFRTFTGEVFVWGPNPFGQLGIGHDQYINTPTQIPLWNIKLARPFNDGTLLLCDDGQVYFTGSAFVKIDIDQSPVEIDTEEELNENDFENDFQPRTFITVPVKVNGLSDIVNMINISYTNPQAWNDLVALIDKNKQTYIIGEANFFNVDNDSVEMRKHPRNSALIPNASNIFSLRDNVLYLDAKMSLHNMDKLRVRNPHQLVPFNFNTERVRNILAASHITLDELIDNATSSKTKLRELFSDVLINILETADRATRLYAFSQLNSDLMPIKFFDKPDDDFYSTATPIMMQDTQAFNVTQAFVKLYEYVVNNFNKADLLDPKEALNYKKRKEDFICMLDGFAKDKFTLESFASHIRDTNKMFTTSTFTLFNYQVSYPAYSHLYHDLRLKLLTAINNDPKLYNQLVKCSKVLVQYFKEYSGENSLLLDMHKEFTALERKENTLLAI